MAEITEEIITPFKQALAQHPIYQAVDRIERLRCFMEHHVYSVWDFMSLIKRLQQSIAPTQYPWAPQGDGAVRRFINELVLEEESDEGMVEGQFSSHFELYLTAMEEVGANTQPVVNFVQQIGSQDIQALLQQPSVPTPSRDFSNQTFLWIEEGELHQVAAALALGREHIIPMMFRTLLVRIGIDEQQAPVFHFYLKRHIHLDEDFHAPLSLRLLNRLCDGDPTKIEEAVAAAEGAVQARLQFWDGVLEAVEQV